MKTSIREANSILENAQNSGESQRKGNIIAPIKYKDIKSLTQDFCRIKRIVERHGYCYIEAWSTDVSILKSIAQSFGCIQSHVRADRFGVVGDSDSKLRTNSWKDYRDEYKGLTSKSFLPHTDGSFLDGIYPINGVMKRVMPPKMIVFQSVKQAKSGGKTLLVDEQKVLSDILSNEPTLAKILMTLGCIVFCRDDQLSATTSVFEKISECRYRVKFRLDDTTYCPSWSYACLQNIHERYHKNKKYVMQINLTPNQILIVDNLRMLHGRESFQGERKLRRIWINDDSAELVSFSGKPHIHRAIEKYEPYTELSGAKSPELALGIKLSADEIKKLT